MSSITAYVVDAEGYYDCTRTGDIDSVMMAVEIEGKDFTMQRPPTEEFKWRWTGSEWIADDTAE